MISFETRGTFETTAGFILMCTFLVPGSGFSQPDSEIAVTDRRQLEIEETLQQARETNGPFSEALIEPLMVLAELYQEAGNHALAVATIGEARQVVRATHGLYSLEEAPLLQLLIRSGEATGDAKTAWHLEQELLVLTERNADDMRTIPILREIAANRMEVLDEYLAGGFPPQIVLGCYYSKRIYTWGLQRMGDSHQECNSGSNTIVIAAMLAEAQSYYTRSIDLLLQNGRESSDELRELETDLLRSSYVFRDYDIRPERDVRQVLRRILDRDSASPAAVLNRVYTLIQLADWEVVAAHRFNQFNSFESVLDLYRQAYAELMAEGAGQTAIDDSFSPEIPVVLPSFRPNPLQSENHTDSRSYIDVAFDITKRGRSERIEILDSAADVKRSDEKELTRMIRQSSFRPRLADGEFADSSRVSLRYYLKD